MRVLLVVDVQKDFCPGGSLAVPGGDEIVPIINELMEHGGFDLIVASKDYHPSDHISFAVNHPGANLFDTVHTGHGDQIVYPNHCEKGTDGAELHPGLKTEFVDYVVCKGTSPSVDSYSAFFDNDGRSETELRAYLEEIAASQGETLSQIELTIVGLCTDKCAGYTARDARKLGIRTELLVDACRPINVNPGDDVEMLRELASLGVHIRESRELFEEREIRVQPAHTASRERSIGISL